MTEHLRRAGIGRSYNRRKRKDDGSADMRLQLPGQMELDVSEWKRMRKIAVLVEARPYVPEEDLTGISVKPNYTPKPGDLIVRDPHDLRDQWLVTAEYAA